MTDSKKKQDFSQVSELIPPNVQTSDAWQDSGTPMEGIDQLKATLLQNQPKRELKKTPKLPGANIAAESPLLLISSSGLEH